MSPSQLKSGMLAALLRFFAFSLAETLALVALAAFAALLVKSPDRGCSVALTAGGVLVLASVAAAASGASSCAAWGRGVLLTGILYSATIMWGLRYEQTSSGLLPTTQLLAQFEPAPASWSVGSPSFPESEYLEVVEIFRYRTHYIGGHVLWCMVFSLLAGRAAQQVHNQVSNRTS